jgi:HSP20 family protein
MLENFFPAVKGQKKEVSPQERESVWDLMEEMLKSPSPESRRISPAVDVTEDEEAIRVKAELPGIDPKEISLTLESSALIIQGERKKEEEKKEENYIRREVSYGSFCRMIPLSVPVKEGEIKARYEKGILEIVLPKAEGAKPRRIEIA